MITWEDTPGKNSWPLKIVFQLYTVRYKHSKQDANSVKCFFSKRASNGEFRNNLQWGLTALCFECAIAVYTQEKQVKALIRWSRAGSFSAFHCCKLRCKILQIIAGKREKGLQLCSFHIRGKQEAYRKEKNWRSVVKAEQKIEVWWDCLYIYSMWSLETDLSTADSKTYSFYSKATFLAGKSFKLLHGSSWLNSKRQRIWSVKRGTQIITGITHRIGHLDLELKAHQTYQEIFHSFQWALDLTLIQCILGWDFLCPDMHLTDPSLNSSQRSRWKPGFKQLCWWQRASWNNLNIVIPHCYL